MYTNQDAFSYNSRKHQHSRRRPKRNSFGHVTGIPEAELASGLILSNGLDCLSVCFFILLLLHHPEMDDKVTNHSYSLCVDMIMPRRRVRVSLWKPL